MSVQNMSTVEELDIRSVVEQCASPSLRVVSNFYDLEKMKNSDGVRAGDLFMDSESRCVYVFDGSVFSPIVDCYNEPLYNVPKDRAKIERVKVCHCPDCGAPVDRTVRVCAYCGVPYPVEYEGG